MEISILLALGILASIFVGINIGGSSAGVAFGPVVGGGILGMRKALLLMGLAAFAGALTIGPRVVETLGKDLVPQTSFTPLTSAIVLFLIGFGLLFSNYLKISSSTSKMAVLAIAGMGAVLGSLNMETLGWILAWWIFTGALAFWIAVFAGRYFYDRLKNYLEGFGKVNHYAAVLMGILMAFAAGANNAANAVAPLVGTGHLSVLQGVILAGSTIALGAVILGSRTAETLGEDITSLDPESTILVQFLTAATIILLSLIGIPASLAHIATLAVIGLGWGRSTKSIKMRKTLGSRKTSQYQQGEVEDKLELFDYQTASKVIKVWVVGPMIVGVLAFVIFVPLTFLGVV